MKKRRKPSRVFSFDLATIAVVVVKILLIIWDEFKQ